MPNPEWPFTTTEAIQMLRIGATLEADNGYKVQIEGSRYCWYWSEAATWVRTPNDTVHELIEWLEEYWPHTVKWKLAEAPELSPG